MKRTGENEITKSESLADVFYYLQININLETKQRKLGDVGQETSESEQSMCDIFLTANTCICALQYNRMRYFTFDQGNVVWDYLGDSSRVAAFWLVAWLYVLFSSEVTLA